MREITAEQQAAKYANFLANKSAIAEDIDKEVKAVGTLIRQGERDGLVLLDRRHPDFGREIYIPNNKLNGAPYGLKVLVEIQGYDPAHGAIVEVIGSPEQNDARMLSVILDFGLEAKYPEAGLKQVADLPSELKPELIEEELRAGRQDLRALETITIDGLDAKDLDDAISLTKEGENFRLYVHIADVSHYVTSGSDLDYIALARGNSVYLVDRVLPMLPPKLSNGLCSLNPQVPRLAFTAEMLFSPAGERLDFRLYPSLIQSDHRGDYTEIHEGTYPPKYRKLLENMYALAELLHSRRRARGSLDFDFPETVVELDSKGQPIDIGIAENNAAHALIEAFMVAANEAVADFGQAHKLPLIYRVHEDPDLERLQALKELLQSKNIKLKLGDKVRPKDLQRVLKQIRGREDAETLSYLLLRSLAKAEYAPLNLGHFGLASKSYLHFTAPIRRYADLHCHRVLKRYLANKQDKSGELKPLTGQIAAQVSATERQAIEAERASVDLKICEFYANKLGEVFRAKITGFSPMAFYARMENSAEGTVLYSELPGYYTFDERLIQAVGPKGRRLKIGDELAMQLLRVDLTRRFLDFRPTKFYTGELAGKEIKPTSRHRAEKSLKKQKKVKRGRKQQTKKKRGKPRRGGIKKFKRQR
ncbi:MAG: VacB/RNase II family 3'-5' exoribonuclease [Eubacteriales bacterium]|nr:VacB/RNase II family 3'-5' exoribonuclease [Eubacteriales bacterium]